MIDFLDLIIILLIIYAILESLLKKKTPSPDRREEDLNFPTDDYIPDSEEKSTQGVFEKIESRFDYEEKLLNDIPIFIENPEIPEDEFERKKTKFPFAKESSNTSVVSYKTQERFDNEALSYYSEEISEFDYNSIDEEKEIFDHSSDSEDIEQVKEELKTFTFNITELDDFRLAIIYKEIFDVPVSVKLIRSQWRKNIH